MSAVVPAGPATRREHNFLTVMAPLMAATVFAGFARTFWP